MPQHGPSTPVASTPVLSLTAYRKAQIKPKRAYLAQTYPIRKMTPLEHGRRLRAEGRGGLPAIIAVIHKLPGARSKAAALPGIVGLSRRERSVMLQAAQWPDGGGKPTIKAMGAFVNLSDKAIRRTVRRLAQAHMLVNLDSGLRGVHLAINPALHEWDLVGLKALRGADSAGVERSFRGGFRDEG